MAIASFKIRSAWTALLPALPGSWPGGQHQIHLRAGIIRFIDTVHLDGSPDVVVEF